MHPFFFCMEDDAVLTPFVPKKIQLLSLIRNTKPTDFEKKSDGWELVLKKAQSKGLYPLNKTWLDFYYEVWIANLDDTIVSRITTIIRQMSIDRPPIAFK